MREPLVTALKEANSALNAQLVSVRAQRQNDLDLLRDLHSADMQVLHEQHVLQLVEVQREVRLEVRLEVEREYAQRLHVLQLMVEKLEAEKRLARAQRFGASSEQGDYQARLFDEAEQSVREAVAEPATIDVAAHTKKKPCRAPLAASLPRVVIEHVLVSPTCACGTELTRITPVISEQVDVIPAQVFVLQHQRQRGVCRACNTAPVTAPLPPQPIPKSLASPGLLAFVGVNKFVDGLPLYRQSAGFARMNIHLPRQTLSGQVVAAGDLATPLINLMTDVLLAGNILAMDETRVQVLKEPGRAAESQSTMWVMRGGSPGREVVRFEYDVSRGKAVVARLLAGYHGYLQRDGYSGYAAVCARPEITGVGCFAHVRRKFIEALKALPEHDKPRGNRTHQGIAFITALYAIERRIADKPPDERKAIRLSEAIPILDRFKVWLDHAGVAPQGLLGKAIRYTLGEWPHLTTYCLDGRLRIDNNLVENAIRPFAVGRKNWLFSDTQQGAVASANLYTLVETARANALNPYAYLKLVFTALPKATTVEDIEALLPWNVAPGVLDEMLRVPTFTNVPVGC